MKGIAHFFLVTLAVMSAGMGSLLAVCISDPSEAPCRGFHLADAVFLGKVLEVRRARLKDVIRFEVKKWWKGSGSNEIIVDTLVGTPMGIHFERGMEYLVYANRNPSGQLGTSNCTRTRLKGKAKRDLVDLRRRESGQDAGTIYGSVSPGKKASHIRARFPDFRVEVTGEGWDTSLAVDEYGSFSIDGLAAGRYLLRLLPPTNLQVQPVEENVDLKKSKNCAKVQLVIP